MPLSQYDPALNYDGSWGDASKSWPVIKFGTKDEAQKAYVAAWKKCKVPYGCYVIVGSELRLETEKYKEMVMAHLGITPYNIYIIPSLDLNKSVA